MIDAPAAFVLGIVFVVSIQAVVQFLKSSRADKDEWNEDTREEWRKRLRGD